ncbi:MAG TPA: c-type cytochrome [Caldilineaceae bacterium]|nr:c-type cytochrome [Caldilineaceae bacterium]
MLFSLCCLALGLGLAGSVAHAQQPSPTYDPTQVTVPINAPIALFGQASYQQNCAPCHGAEGMGNGPTAAELPGPPTAFADPDAIWALSPSELFHTTKFGRLENLMPPWGNQLSDEEIWQTVAYAWSLHTTRSETDNGAELYTANCAACHGDTGAGDGPEAPPDLVDFTDLDYAINNSQADWSEGWQSAHPELGAEWSAGQQQSVLEYIRTFSYVPPWENAYQPGSGVISGTVVQGTAGGAAVVGLTAALEAYMSFTPVAVFTTPVDSQGGFVFTDVSTTPGIDYLVSVASEGIRYSSPILRFTAEQSALETQVAIYGTTDDPAGIHINSVHWIVDPQPGAVVVGEVYSLGNGGDRSYVGTTVDGVEEPVTVAMRVPADAQELSFENGALGGRFQQVGDRVYDTTPVVPGQSTRQIIMRYVLPHNGTSLDVRQDFLYPVDQMTVLVTELPQLDVTIPGFSLASREELQGQTYQLWRPDGNVPNEVTVQLAGLLRAGDIDPRMVQGSNGQSGLSAASATVVPLLEPWAPWSLAALLVIAVIGVLIWSRGRVGVDQAKNLRGQRTRLLKQIAHLDDRHATGEIDEQQWQQVRSQLKAQLLQMTSRLEEER